RSAKIVFFEAKSDQNLFCLAFEFEAAQVFELMMKFPKAFYNFKIRCTGVVLCRVFHFSLSLCEGFFDLDQVLARPKRFLEKRTRLGVAVQRWLLRKIADLIAGRSVNRSRFGFVDAGDDTQEGRF